MLSNRVFVVGAVLLPVAWVGAEPVPVGGHWEGAIHAPVEDVVVAVDLAFDESGRLVGTFSNPAQQLNGFPLWSASVDGEVVKLELKTADPGVQTFDGKLSADGQKITGQFLIDVHAVPFTLTRNGEARIAPAPHSAALDATLVGSWLGSLDYGVGQSLPLRLTLTNHADATATGTWTTGGGPPTPIAIEAEGTGLTLTSPIAPATFTGTVNAQASEIAGTLLEGGKSRPVIFTRVDAGS